MQGNIYYWLGLIYFRPTKRNLRPSFSIFKLFFSQRKIVESALVGLMLIALGYGVPAFAWGCATARASGDTLGGAMISGCDCPNVTFVSAFRFSLRRCSALFVIVAQA